MQIFVKMLTGRPPSSSLRLHAASIAPISCLGFLIVFVFFLLASYSFRFVFSLFRRFSVLIIRRLMIQLLFLCARVSFRFVSLGTPSFVSNSSFIPGPSNPFGDPSLQLPSYNPYRFVLPVATSGDSSSRASSSKTKARFA
jgi:hypothetical protein